MINNVNKSIARSHVIVIWLILLVMAAGVFAGDLTVDNLTVNGVIDQSNAGVTNTINADAKLYGVVAVPKRGDIDMSTVSPEWWTNRSLLAVDMPGSDYSPVVIGQMKWIATNACAEMNEKLSGGAGSAVQTLVNGFSTNDNYNVINIGQLKGLAEPFYDRLIVVGFTNAYPWTATTADDNDFAAANIGQVRTVFGFDLGADTDCDGLVNTVETDTGVYVSEEDTGSDPADSDSDDDGVEDGDEVAARTDPNVADIIKPITTITFPQDGAIIVRMP